ncbi:TetR/AcrR family transcriptional regulator [Desertimonas flava]|uniref:TetR/AcrR family transcriptional regulator n=1 Tax=Desertimonas flava TaxID=2064846 RepID=UPI0013C4E7B2|nr:TetR/AcrR family transcriptional regulator [Desertimonas flava]
MSPSERRSALEPKAMRTRQRILEAAAELFRDRGYSNTRLTDIAERAGVQTGSLYYHFASREALVGEILHIGMGTAWRHVHQAVDSLASDAAPIERVAAAIKAHLLVVLDISTIASAQSRVVNEVPDDVRAAHLDEQRAYGNYWRSLLEDAQRAGELDPGLDLYVFGVALFGMMNATTALQPERVGDAEAVASIIVGLVLDGVRVGRPKRRAR